MIVDAIRSLIDDVIGHGAEKKYLNIIGAFASSSSAPNLFGLFFFLQPPDRRRSRRRSPSPLISFVYFNWQGIREHGFSGTSSTSWGRCCGWRRSSSSSR